MGTKVGALWRFRAIKMDIYCANSYNVSWLQQG